MIHHYDLGALGLLPPRGRPLAPPRRIPLVLLPALALCDMADAAWLAWADGVRACLRAGIAALDVAERAGARR